MFKGTHWTQMENKDEIRLKMSQSLRGRKLSEEHKRKIAESCKRVGSGKWMRGKKASLETRKKQSLAVTGDKSPQWKGNDVGYFALHSWIRRQLGNPSLCEDCRSTSEKRYEWANISGKYLRDIDDWKRLCKQCHARFDYKENMRIRDLRGRFTTMVEVA